MHGSKAIRILLFLYINRGRSLLTRELYGINPSDRNGIYMNRLHRLGKGGFVNAEPYRNTYLWNITKKGIQYIEDNYSSIVIYEL